MTEPTATQSSAEHPDPAAPPPGMRAFVGWRLVLVLFYGAVALVFVGVVASIVVDIEFLSNVTFDMLKFIPFVDKVVYTHVNVPAVVRTPGTIVVLTGQRIIVPVTFRFCAG